jgi:hypothetical protein
MCVKWGKNLHTAWKFGWILSVCSLLSKIWEANETEFFFSENDPCNCLFFSLQLLCKMPSFKCTINMWQIRRNLTINISAKKYSFRFARKLPFCYCPDLNKKKVELENNSFLNPAIFFNEYQFILFRVTLLVQKGGCGVKRAGALRTCPKINHRTVWF